MNNELKTKKLYIIGIGPGSSEYLTTAAIEKAKEMDILAGSKKALSLFSELDKKTHTFEKEIQPFVDFLKSNYRDSKIGVLVTGDPGLYSLAATLKKHFEPQELVILPGISSIQLFFARLGLSYEDVKLESVHGREMDHFFQKIGCHKKVCLLTDSTNSPKKIASKLLEANIEARLWIGQNISLPDEIIAEKSLDEVAKNGDYKNALVYLEFERT